MEQSLPNFAKEALSTLKNSFFQGRGGYYAQMDQESENEDDGNDNTMSHSLFYSIHQNQHNINEDSIPLTESNAYSDRSQLLFEQEDDSDYDDSDVEESPVSFCVKHMYLLMLTSLKETLGYLPRPAQHFDI